MLRATGWAFVLAVVLSTACGDDDGAVAGTGGVAGASSAGTGGMAGAAGTGGMAGAAGTGGAGNAPWTFQQYLDAEVERICTMLIDCPPANDDEVGARAVLRTKDRCRQHYRSLPWVQTYTSFRQEALTEGRLAFDGAAAQQCAALHAACDKTPELVDDDACLHVLTGLVPIGSPCRSNEECAGSAYCRSESDECPGTCIAKIEVGQPCDSARQCLGAPNEAHCDYDAQPAVCVLRPLVQRAEVGQACGDLSDGTRDLCMPGAWCQRQQGDQGVCQPPLSQGGPCGNAESLCEGLSFCVEDTCEEVTVVDQVGGACDEGGGIVARMCDPLARLICVNGACELAGDGGEGSRCVPGDLGDASCNAGYYCDWDTDACLPLRSAGDECNSSQQCEQGCNFTTLTCNETLCIN